MFSLCFPWEQYKRLFVSSFLFASSYHPFIELYLEKAVMCKPATASCANGLGSSMESENAVGLVGLDFRVLSLGFLRFQGPDKSSHLPASQLGYNMQDGFQWVAFHCHFAHFYTSVIHLLWLRVGGSNERHQALSSHRTVDQMGSRSDPTKPFLGRSCH